MGIYLFGKFRKMIDMDVYHYRRENTRWLCQEEHGGSISAMANRLDRQQSLISRWIGKTKNPKTIGSWTARRIEREYHKSKGWLDIPHDFLQLRDERNTYVSSGEKQIVLSEESVALAEVFQLLPVHVKNHVRLLIHDIVVSRHCNSRTQKAYSKASPDEQLQLKKFLKMDTRKTTKKSRHRKKGS